MIGIENALRQQLGKELDNHSQEEVMAKIPQFFEADIHRGSEQIKEVDGQAGGRKLSLSVFNMERGVHLDEIKEYLRDCPGIQPLDVILANELDDGCCRSANRDVAKEVAESFGYHYVYSLEFIELVNQEDQKGFHGNAIFSKWPITRAKVVRLPEEYNWYFDRQKRIGSRCAVFAEIDMKGQKIGLVSLHLENRTDGAGRARQINVVFDEVDRFFKGLPVLVGGDLNTNTFDGRSKEDIGVIAADEELRRKCLEDVFAEEELLPQAEERGYTCLPTRPVETRRKPLPSGGYLGLRLDWLMLRGFREEETRLLVTDRNSFTFAKAGGRLEKFAGQELSDHNAIWSEISLL